MPARANGRKQSRQANKETEPTLVDRFREVSDRINDGLGTPWALFAAGLLIIVWAITGPIFRFSDSWQLVINTGTTIITFLMVFVIQTSQNRQSKAIQFKLDELIRSNPRARNQMIRAERETSEALKREEEAFQRTAERGGRSDVPPEEHQEEAAEHRSSGATTGNTKGTTKSVNKGVNS
jgi:low affinity Fe/Cu permease